MAINCYVAPVWKETNAWICKILDNPFLKSKGEGPSADTKCSQPPQRKQARRPSI